MLYAEVQHWEINYCFNANTNQDTMELCFYVDYLARKILVGYEFSGKYFMEFIKLNSVLFT